MQQTPVRITTVTGAHVAGKALTIHGTAAANHVIFVSASDPRHPKHRIGSATSSSSGAWQLNVPHGFLYNTVLQATSGQQKSNNKHVGVHQVLKIKSVKFVGEGSNGFRYKLAGMSASHIPGEAITVVFNGKTVGKTRMHSNGTFTVTFTVPQRSEKLTLHGSGRSKSGVQYTLAGNKKFRTS